MTVVEDCYPDLDEDPAEQEKTWEQRAARWSPRLFVETAPVHEGRPPRMTYWPWHSCNASTELGAVADDQHYWRCRRRGCRRYGGPYEYAMSASDGGGEHARLHHHDLLSGAG